MGIYVYMLRCADNSFYVGSATGHDLSPRIGQHNAGAYPGYTFTRRPVVLVWSQYFDRITDGIAAERQIKGWSRKKKQALIKSDWFGKIASWMVILRGSQALAPQDDGISHLRVTLAAPSGTASKIGAASTA